MVDLNLKREMSFGTFAKELTGLWGPDDSIDTPKGRGSGIFAAPGEGAKVQSRNDAWDMNLLMRSDSKEPSKPGSHGASRKNACSHA